LAVPSCIHVDHALDIHYAAGGFWYVCLSLQTWSMHAWGLQIAYPPNHRWMLNPFSRIFFSLRHTICCFSHSLHPPGPRGPCCFWVHFGLCKAGFPGGI